MTLRTAPGEEAPTLDVEERVDLLLRRRGELLLVARVEVERVGRKRGHLRPVDVVVDVVEPAAAFVRQRDPAGLRERHRPVGVARASLGARADHLGLDPPLEPVADRPEVADRRVDGGLRIPVVVDAQPDEPRPRVLVGRDRQPDVRDDAGPVQVREDDRLARDRLPAVVVGGGIRARRGHALRLRIFHLRECESVERRKGSFLRGQGQAAREAENGRENPLPHRAPSLANSKRRNEREAEGF